MLAERASIAKFGRVSRFQNTYTYTGRRLDEKTGLHYYRYRYYEARMGRFVGRDPAKSPWRNTYGYVENALTRMIDPAGLASWPSDGGSINAHVPANTNEGAEEGGVAGTSIILPLAPSYLDQIVRTVTAEGAGEDKVTVTAGYRDWATTDWSNFGQPVTKTYWKRTECACEKCTYKAQAKIRYSAYRDFTTSIVVNSSLEKSLMKEILTVMTGITRTPQLKILGKEVIKGKLSDEIRNKVAVTTKMGDWYLNAEEVRWSVVKDSLKCTPVDADKCPQSIMNKPAGSLELVGDALNSSVTTHGTNAQVKNFAHGTEGGLDVSGIEEHYKEIGAPYYK